jgi:nitrogen fixation protein FixH
MPKKNSALRSPWVIGWIALVITVLTVNGVMIFLAVENKPGLVVEDYYERGQDYEKHMLERMQRNPGWLMKIDAPDPIFESEPAWFRFTVVDKAGLPVTPKAVMFFAYRPSDARRDFSVPMEPEAPGRYGASAEFPLKGVWDILVSVQGGEDEYNTARRINVAEKNGI